MSIHFYPAVILILMRARQRWLMQRYSGLGAAIAISICVSIFLFALRVIAARNGRYAFLIWNLVLGCLPVVFALWLWVRLKYHKWRHPLNVLLTVLWLGFLPNSFYLLSDLVHLKATGEVSLLFDAVMFSSFIFNGFVAGFISLQLVHYQIIKRYTLTVAHSLVIGVLFLCSFAIYLGRNLRWNTWDVLINPAGLVFDVSDRIINPTAHPQSFPTTMIFFLLLVSIYAVIWEAIQVLRHPNKG
jgi:uncharacterized membrane protein